MSRRSRAFLAGAAARTAPGLHVLRSQGEVEVVGLLTTLNEVHQRVAMHAVRHALLVAQAEAAGLSLIEVQIPHPCPGFVFADLLPEDGPSEAVPDETP